MTSHSIHRVSRVAQVYADALFELAENADAVSAVEKDLSDFAEAVRSVEPLRRLLVLPGAKNETRASALVAVLEKAGAHELVRNVAGAAARNGRASELPDVAQAFAQRAADSRGEVRALVTLAQAPSEAQETDIRARFKEVLGKEPVMTIDIDPALLGGMIARVGSRLVDASLRSRLEGVREAMKGAS